MITIDTNIIIHALASSQPEHRPVSAWIESVEDRLATTQTNGAEVLRLLTHPRVFARPLGLDAAVQVLSEFVEAYGIVILEDSPDWWRMLPSLQDRVVPEEQWREGPLHDGRRFS